MRIFVRTGQSLALALLPPSSALSPAFCLSCYPPHSMSETNALDGFVLSSSVVVVAVAVVVVAAVSVSVPSVAAWALDDCSAPLLDPLAAAAVGVVAVA